MLNNRVVWIWHGFRMLKTCRVFCEIYLIKSMIINRQSEGFIISFNIF